MLLVYFRWSLQHIYVTFPIAHLVVSLSNLLDTSLAASLSVSSIQGRVVDFVSSYTAIRDVRSYYDKFDSHYSAHPFLYYACSFLLRATSFRNRASSHLFYSILHSSNVLALHHQSFHLVGPAIDLLSFPPSEHRWAVYETA
jgi:hypothetical protein